ncbi:MAG: DNA replication/repair protein RecF [Peptostreptococcales bacterium]
MFIKNIHIKNFRNYKEEIVSFNKKFNIIIGKNGQGKTNLIESIYLMSIGKSFRSFNDNDMIQLDQDNALINGVICKKYSEVDIQILLSRKNKKIIKLNQTPLRRNSQILNNVYIVCFTPEDLRIVKDGPEKRRNFINRELCQIKPLYYSQLYKYNKILVQRNACLKNINNFNKKDDMMLDIWNKEMIKYGINLIKNREEFIKRLNNISKKIHAKLTNEKENLEILYDCSVDKAEEIKEENYYKKLKETEKKDIMRGYTSIGPHKDDLIIKINGIDVRNFGSQGQQRTASLSLKLAEIKLIAEETGEIPILILDDVLSELDQYRQNYLVNFLKNMQVFITTTEIKEFIVKDLQEYSIFNIQEGNIEKKQ